MKNDVNLEKKTFLSIVKLLTTKRTIIKYLLVSNKVSDKN